MRSARSLLHWAALPLTVVWVGCAQDKPKTDATPKAAVETPASAPAGAATANAKPAPAPIKLPEGTGPVATVNGEKIARDVFNREYTQTLQRYQKARHDVKPALQERFKDNIVRRLVDAELIRQQAVIMKVQVEGPDTAEKWEAHKKRYGSDEAFKSFLERAGTSADDVRRQFENNLLREKVFAKVSEGVQADPKEVKKFYKDNMARYDEPEQIKASHILFRVAPNASPEDKAKKKASAEDVLKQLKKKGAKFEDLAKKFGEDPTKDRGGDLGYFVKGRMVKAFEEAAWKLKKGKVSKLVETQFGFHIIKKTDYKKARKKPFKEVKEQIERSLMARKRNQAIRDALAKWKANAKIEIFVKGDPAIISAAQPKPALGRPNLKPRISPNAKTLTGANLKLKVQPNMNKTSDKPAK